jgi:ribokinase
MGLGAEGALLCLPGEGRLLRRPACQIGGIVNTVGAGDALFSAFIHGYYGGLSPVEALDRAQLFAALKIRHNGAAEGFVSAAELEAAFRGI